MNKIKIFYVPKLRLRDQAILISLAILLMTFLISISSKCGKIDETIRVSFFVSGFLFIYYTIMIYFGFRYDSGNEKWQWNGLTYKDAFKELSNSGVPDLGGIGLGDFGDSVFGLIVTIIAGAIIGFIIAIGVVILAWIGINIIGYTIFLVWIPIYVILRLFLRNALVNMRKNQGNILKSMKFSTIHSISGGISVGLCFFMIELIASITLK